MNIVQIAFKELLTNLRTKKVAKRNLVIMIVNSCGKKEIVMNYIREHLDSKNVNYTPTNTSIRIMFLGEIKFLIVPLSERVDDHTRGFEHDIPILYASDMAIDELYGVKRPFEEYFPPLHLRKDRSGESTSLDIAVDLAVGEDITVETTVKREDGNVFRRLFSRIL